MKLEELLEYISNDTSIILTDDESHTLPVSNDKDGIPAFLLNCHVSDIHAISGSRLEIGIDFNDFTKAVDYVRDRANNIYEDLSDSYRCDNVDIAKSIVRDGLVDLRNDIENIVDNIECGRIWDAGLDY